MGTASPQSSRATIAQPVCVGARFQVGRGSSVGAEIVSGNENRRTSAHVAKKESRPHMDGSVTLSLRSEEHTSELQSLMRISYAVFCLKKKRPTTNTHNYTTTP